MASNKIDLRAVNRGRLKHPTFGHRPFVFQTIQGGFWNRAAEKAGEEAADAMFEALRQVARDIASGAGKS